MMNKRTVLHILKWLFVSGSVLYLTRSWMMTLGILLLLLLVDALLAEFDARRKRERDRK